MGNNVLYNLLDYRNRFIDNITTKERVVRNLLIVIGAPIKEKILLSQDFYISNDGSRLNSLKNSRRSDSTLIINITESIINKEIEIDDLARKRYIFSNDVNRIRKHKNYFKPVLNYVIVIIIRRSRVRGQNKYVTS